MPRVRGPEHGCLMVQVPWAEDSSRYAAIFVVDSRSTARYAHLSRERLWPPEPGTLVRRGGGGTGDRVLGL